MRGFSLLGASLGTRLLLAASLIAALWALAVWAVA